MRHQFARLCKSTLRLMILLPGLVVLIQPASAQQDQPVAVDRATSSPAGEPAVTDQLQTRVIIVAEGDTLMSLSRAQFGTVALWRHVAEYNQLAVEDPLYTGQLVLIPTLQTVPRQYAVVVYTHGAATRTSDGTGEPISLAGDDRIYPTDIIETGVDGFASISFQNGSVVNLQPATRVQLIHLGCLSADKTCFIDIAAPAGNLDTDVRSRDGQPTYFHIKTPFADAAVRGTQFDFGASAQALILGVTDGSVTIRAEGAEVSLERGFGAKTEAGSPPGAPVALLHFPAFTNIPPRVASGDRLGWWQISAAKHYDWIISSDSAVSNILQSDRTVLGDVTIDDLAAGDYYLSIRAVDGNGLKGFQNTEKISVAEIAPDVAPVALVFTREGRELQISVVEPDASTGGYEIQLASSRRFMDVISIDVGTAGRALFSDTEEPLFIRARALFTPTLVSAFGPILQTD